MLAMRRHAAWNEAASSARMTPRLADSPMGLSTHGKRTRPMAAAGPAASG
jgi:hypothetical protein